MALIIVSASILLLLSYAQTLRIAPTQSLNDLEFDGENGHLLLDMSFARQQIIGKGISLAVWTMIYPQQQETPNPIINMKNFQLYLSNESSNGRRFVWMLWNSSKKEVVNFVTSPNTPEFFTWYFIVGTWDATSGNMSLYINGEIANDTKTSTSVELETDTLIVGKDDNNNYLYGRISNLQIYSGSITPNDVENLYKTGHRGSALQSEGIIGWWRLNGDFSSYNNGHNFHPVGDVKWIQSLLLLFPYDVLSTISVYCLLASALALLPFYSWVNKKEIFAPLRTRYNSYIIIVFFKSFIAMITPLSQDFMYILHTSSFNTPPIGAPVDEGGFWFLVVHSFSRLWNLFPVSHPNMQVLFSARCSVMNMIPFFLDEGASGLFAWVLLAKIPYIILDIGVALIIYKIMSKLPNSTHLAVPALFLWLLNPFSLILIEMWTSNDVPMVFFLLISLYYLIDGKKVRSAFFYGLSVATRLVPIIFLPIMLFAFFKRDTYPERVPSVAGWRERTRSLIGPLQFLSIAVFTFLVVNLPLFFPTDHPQISNLPGGSSRLLWSSSYLYFFGITLGSATMNLARFSIGVAVVLFTFFCLYIAKTWSSEKTYILESFFVLFLVLFTFSYWNPQYWLWIMPFIIMKLRLTPEYKRIVYLQLFLFLLINVTIFGYYYSTWGKSFFFFPNYNSTLQLLSSFLFNIGGQPFFTEFRIDQLLVSFLIGVNIWILLRQTWSMAKRLR